MFSSFTLLVKVDDYLPLKTEVERWKDIAEITASYKEKDYYLVDLLVLDEKRGPAELFKFVDRHFNYIALHQSKSTYIFTRDKDEFKKTINDLYDKESRDYFFYDMLTTEERYHALMSQDIENQSFLQAWYFNHKSSCYYALEINEGSTYLFSEESYLDVLDNTTGEITEYDIMDGLTEFKFHIGILRSEKLEK
jgi:hypothetical protein